MPMHTLRDLWERNSRLHPEHIAVKDEQHTLSHREFLLKSTQLANALFDGGVGQGDRVAILSMNRVEYMVALAANHILGSIAATLNFRLAAAELEWILADSSPTVLIFEYQYLAMVDVLRPGLPAIQRYLVIGCEGKLPLWAEGFDQVMNSGSSALPFKRPEAEDIAHLIYTSGTTGRPKGVMRSHRCEIYMAESLSYGMDARPDSRILEVMPLFHTGAQSSACACLWRGGTVFIDNVFEPQRLLSLVEREGITHLHVVPLMIQDLLNVSDICRYNLSSLETLLYAAAPITPAVLRKGLEIFGPVFVGAWGMTEGGSTFLPKAAHKPNGSTKDLALLSSVGQEVQRARVRIVNDRGDDCAAGESGELLLKSIMLMSGYWNNPEATNDAFIDGWLRTGDMGYFDEQNYVYLVDRKKDMIISGGENIYSQEVERALAENEVIDRAVVIGVPDDRWGEVVKAIVVLRQGADVRAEDIIEHCGKHIANYKKPKSVEIVDALPALPSGKVNKVELRKIYGCKA